ncbi:UDP-N-acetylmuramoyl-L-alanine--D-glutamate ligase [Desulfococcaceae bacterium HSG8]|nr:UDP-N-acetylmuramoyl-L-alanine--D-glutamate ligase [Desulfococcaceae bacterium HSG8]
MNSHNKKILIVGLGKSGAAAARFLKNRGGLVTVTDMAGEEQLEAYIPLMRDMGIRTELGEHRIETFEESDYIVVSPGVPHTIAPIKAAQEKGIPVLGEIELASRFIAEPVVAVTGTNGKTTTTTLLGKMLEHSGLDVFVGGNIGNPLIGYAEGEEKADVVVAEISSFQLDTIESFRPKVGVLLNITEDHLDRYAGFEAYAESKARIFENQQENDVAVLDSSDTVVRSVTRHIRSRKMEIGNRESLANGRLRISDFEFKIPDTLPGPHNMQNISAACLAALASGGTPEGIQSALDNFRGLPHRLEYVATINGVRYFDDSKATNTDAVAKAIESFHEPIILIMGGQGKNCDFHSLKGLIRRHVKKLIVMGESGEEIKSVLGQECGTGTASAMDDAVFQAYQASEPGDAVLLSPACASFDMYRSYAERGEFFCSAVEKLAM